MKKSLIRKPERIIHYVASIGDTTKKPHRITFDWKYFSISGEQLGVKKRTIYAHSDCLRCALMLLSREFPSTCESVLIDFPLPLIKCELCG